MLTPTLCHMSCVTCHVSHVSCHMLRISFSFFRQSVGASRWTVCYQRDLPRLVQKMDQRSQYSDKPAYFNDQNCFYFNLFLILLRLMEYFKEVGNARIWESFFHTLIQLFGVWVLEIFLWKLFIFYIFLMYRKLFMLDYKLNYNAWGQWKKLFVTISKQTRRGRPCW